MVFFSDEMLDKKHNIFLRFLEKLYFLFSAQILHFVFLNTSISFPSQSFSPSSAEIKQSVCQFLQHISILCTKKINLNFPYLWFNIIKQYQGISETFIKAHWYFRYAENHTASRIAITINRWVNVNSFIFLSICKN